MGDYSTYELAGAAGVTVSVGAALFLLLQAIKDFAPNLSGRAALGVVYALAFLIAAVIVSSSDDADWSTPATYLAVVIIGLSVSLVGKGIYAQLFKVAVAGLPPSPDAVVAPEDVQHEP